MGLLLRENRGVYECWRFSDDDGAVSVTGIIKRNNLEVREKVWKVSEVVSSIIEHNSDVNEQIIYITDAYWIDEYGNKQRDLNINSSVTLYVQTKNFVVGKLLICFLKIKKIV